MVCFDILLLLIFFFFIKKIIIIPTSYQAQPILNKAPGMEEPHKTEFYKCTSVGCYYYVMLFLLSFFILKNRRDTENN